MSFNIAFILFPDFEELDFVGPYEVFGMTSKYIDHEWRVYSVAEQREVRAFHGLRVIADHTLRCRRAEAGPDLRARRLWHAAGQRARTADVIHPAHRRSGAVRDVRLHRRLPAARRRLSRRQARDDALGREEGVRATSAANTQLVDERWVHDGNVITAAGVSAGIDMALYVVGMLKSPEDARKVQRVDGVRAGAAVFGRGVAWGPRSVEVTAPPAPLHCDGEGSLVAMVAGKRDAVVRARVP